MADGGCLSADAACAFILRSMENTLGNGNGCTLQAIHPLSSITRKKRPPMLQIPTVVPGKPPPPDSRSPESAAAAAAGVSAAGPGWGVFSRKGRRKNSLEDFYTALPSPKAHPRCKGFFGVYDGHGGRSAGKYVTAKLHENVLQMLAKCEGADGGGVGREEAIRAGFLKTDQEFLETKAGSGSCGVTAVIEAEGLAVSNVGDCRAVLSRGGIAEALTNDHKGSRPDEKARIEAKGGFMVCRQGIWRVQGDLAITRSFGDAHLKEWGVSAEPDTVVLPVTPDMDFLILASDGLWDKLSNQEAVDTVAQFRLLNDNAHQMKQVERSRKRKREAMDEYSKADEERALPCSKLDNDGEEELCGRDDKSTSSSVPFYNHKVGCVEACSCASDTMEIGVDFAKETTKRNEKITGDGKKQNGNSPPKTNEETSGEGEKQIGTSPTVTDEEGITGDGQKRNGSSPTKAGEGIEGDGDKQYSGTGNASGCSPSRMGEAKMDNEAVASQDAKAGDKPSCSECTRSCPPQMTQKASRISCSSYTMLQVAMQAQPVLDEDKNEVGGQHIGDHDDVISCPATTENITGDRGTQNCCDEKSSSGGRNNETVAPNHGRTNGERKPSSAKETSGLREFSEKEEMMAGENHQRYADENAPPPPKKLKLEDGAMSGCGGGTPSNNRRGEGSTPNPKEPRSVWAAASEKLAGVALKRGSNDDITVMIIDMKHYFQ